MIVYHLFKLRIECILCVYFIYMIKILYIYSISLHDALPISVVQGNNVSITVLDDGVYLGDGRETVSNNRVGSSVFARKRSGDRKSTRLNSSHVAISYAVFCSKKKIIAQYE